ncbi:26S proteasome non-ATPase regulatory subunit 9 isoform X1 [Paroedura picta]|uniref:26S proteasome non-ATPase regulatory subunit 9 isoform X1 n=1 Tax=Paroedura picta TaxID=143630 RepID=UPI0040560A87
MHPRAPFRDDALYRRRKRAHPFTRTNCPRLPRALNTQAREPSILPIRRLPLDFGPALILLAPPLASPASLCCHRLLQAPPLWRLRKGWGSVACCDGAILAALALRSDGGLQGALLQSSPSVQMSQQEPGVSTALTVSEVQQLLKKKDEIEAQIKAYYEVLEDQKGVGMNEPLVDVEGYPRADVDVYQVRTARHNIICLQNDHKALMKEVEQALHQLHAHEKEKREKDEAEARAEARSQSEAPPLPFARVNAVTPGSPASMSGLQVDDEIVEFGSVNTRNFQSIQNIATVVQHSEGRSLSVTVLRRGERMHLGLTPKRWTGKGLLGCNIVPLQR